MATSEAELGNLALAQLGSGIQIASLTERSNEARAVSLWYAQTRDLVLSAFPWPFALRQVALALVDDGESHEWGYAYRYPAEALTLWRIVGYDRLQGAWCEWSTWPWAPALQPPPFRIRSDATGKLVECDLDQVTVEYTHQLTDVTQYPADFAQALSHKLAEQMAPLVTQGDQFRLGDKARDKYAEALTQAQMRAANEERRDRWISTDSDLTRSRQ